MSEARLPTRRRTDRLFHTASGLRSLEHDDIRASDDDVAALAAAVMKTSPPDPLLEATLLTVVARSHPLTRMLLALSDMTAAAFPGALPSEERSALREAGLSTRAMAIGLAEDEPVSVTISTSNAVVLEFGDGATNGDVVDLFERAKQAALARREERTGTQVRTARVQPEARLAWALAMRLRGADWPEIRRHFTGMLKSWAAGVREPADRLERAVYEEWTANDRRGGSAPTRNELLRVLRRLAPTT